MDLRVYRIVITNPPTERDMLSQQALGRPLHSNKPELRRAFDGVSVFDSEQRARETAQRRPWQGSGFIAELHIPEGSAIRREKTFGQGHYTLWGDAAILLSYVVRVVPV